MDREFIRSFYQRYYENPQGEAVKDSEEYKNKRDKRYEEESKLIKLLEKTNSDLLNALENYLDACADEQDVLLEETYLMGAYDHEKMLREII